MRNGSCSDDGVELAVRASACSSLSELSKPDEADLAREVRVLQRAQHAERRGLVRAEDARRRAPSAVAERGQQVLARLDTALSAALGALGQAIIFRHDFDEGMVACALGSSAIRRVERGVLAPRFGGSAAMGRFLGVSLLVVVLGLAGAGTVSAQGFGVYEQGACMMGRGGAGVADPCPDGSGVFFNPAALSFGPKVITLGRRDHRSDGQFHRYLQDVDEGHPQHDERQVLPGAEHLHVAAVREEVCIRRRRLRAVRPDDRLARELPGPVRQLQERPSGVLHPADVRREAPRERVGRRRCGRDLSERRAEPARGPLDPDCCRTVRASPRSAWPRAPTSPTSSSRATR